MQINRDVVLIILILIGTFAYAAGSAISSISPMSATTSDSAFTLIVNGANFKNSSLVLWNGSQRPTTYVNSSTLQAAISAADVATSGTASISVQTGSATSASVAFTINVTAGSAAAAITSITPLSTAAGSSNFTLVVNGTGFSSSSQILWNGTALPTTFVNSSTLTAQLNATDVTAASVVPVAVIDGGAQSNAVSFTIAATTPSQPPPPPPPPPPTTGKVVVSVTSPTPNQVVCGSTVSLSASAVTANTGASITGWWVYDNGNGVWNMTGNRVLISTSLILTSGSHTIEIKAWDSTGASGYVDVPITVNSSCGTPGPTGTGPISGWQGSMYNNGGNLDQAISFDVAQTANYPFDAYLFYGATCDPAQLTDRIGFGNPQPFSAGMGYTYMFIHYPNKTNMSAIWMVGTQSSGCINYATAPIN